MWVVRITKRGDRFDFRSDFFPRRMGYKRDALDLLQEVKDKGGNVVVEKEEKPKRYGNRGIYD